MRVWTRLENYQKDSARPLILALGNFDGLHSGHQEILQRVRDRARLRNGIPAVLTFFEHPQRVLHHSSRLSLLTSPQHRLLLFHEKRIEICFLVSFTIPFSKTTPETFVEEWLVQRLGVGEVHLGYNAHFGFDRKGDARLMRELAARLGFEFHESSPVKIEGEFISSSLIRRLIQEGELGQAKRFLGRPFSILASVVRGSGRGKELGFPTANLKPHSEILPPRGVYPVEVREACFHLRPTGRENEFEHQWEQVGEWRQGILNYGVRPTFEGTGEAVPEVFLFDFTGNLYGKTVEVIFHPRLREEEAFRNARELTQAIEKDVADAGRYFAKCNKQTGTPVSKKALQ